MEPAVSLPLSVNSVTVPPAPVLLKPVTIEFPLTFFVAFAGLVKLFDMKVKEPVVLVTILVNVLLLTLVTSGPAVADPA